jgi:hypothetical protein
MESQREDSVSDDTISLFTDEGDNSSRNGDRNASLSDLELDVELESLDSEQSQYCNTHTNYYDYHLDKFAIKDIGLEEDSESTLDLIDQEQAEYLKNNALIPLDALTQMKLSAVNCNKVRAAIAEMCLQGNKQCKGTYIDMGDSGILDESLNETSPTIDRTKPTVPQEKCNNVTTILAHESNSPEGNNTKVRTAIAEMCLEVSQYNNENNRL